MGLDQYLYHDVPNPLDPYDHGPQLAYWRKDWDLQTYIGTDNCEPLELTLSICDTLLEAIPAIYRDSEGHYYDYTVNAFTKARELLLNGERIIYCADW